MTRLGHPKPPVVAKEPKPLKRGKPLPRGAGPKRKKKGLKFGNAYTRPYPVAQARRVRKRCKGVCEARICCNGDPMEGMPHHKRYDERFKGPKRLEVPDEDVIGVCRRCHLWFENEKANARKDAA